MVLESCLERDGEPALGAVAIAPGDRDPVRDHDETAQKASSQGLDSRMAELIRPTIE